MGRVFEVATREPLPVEVRGEFERGSFIFNLGPPEGFTDVAVWLAGTEALLSMLGVPLGDGGGLIGFASVGSGSRELHREVAQRPGATNRNGCARSRRHGFPCPGSLRYQEPEKGYSPPSQRKCG